MSERWSDVAAERATERSKTKGRAPLMQYFLEFWRIYDKGTRRKLAGTALAVGALFATLAVSINLKP